MYFKIENRFESIDILRGVAALSVCIYHFSIGLPDFLSDENPLKIIGQHGYLGVQVFFIISGFIIPFSLYKGNYNSTKFFTFFSKRIIRIDPPYLISIALAILLKYLSTFSLLYRGPEFNISAQNILCHIGYLCDICNEDWINPVYWTLAIEFQFYILIAICYTHFIVSKNNYLFYAALFLLNIPALLSLTNPDYILHYISYFTIGIVYFRTILNKIKPVTFYIITSLLLLDICIVHGGAEMLASAATVLIILFVKKSTAPFIFLGKISFSLYLLHTIIGSRIINFSITITQNEVYRVLIVFIALLISIVCAYVFYLFIEKPFMKLSQRITYTKTNA
ncbi:acyltransferase family protein [Cytophaga aurantiaca]|uniref:acyltransferase family protein n=1 Tax=Cytophaga aurantiaca TaxID=29530 RepID=UPI00037A8BF0